MYSFLSTGRILIAVVMLACWTTSSQAFAPIQYVVSPRTAVTAESSSALEAEKKKGKDEAPSFLMGGGARITIRQDEDSAMWVEEPKTKDAKTKTAAPKAKGKAAPAKPEEKKGFKFPFF